MKVELYANYGLMARESRAVFTVGCPVVESNDMLMVEIPDELNPYLTVTGEVAVQIGNHKYLVRELLAEKGGRPVLRWVDLDTRKRRTIVLRRIRKNMG